MRVHERLMKYVQVHTASATGEDCVPSTPRQFDLADILADEMRDMGVENVYVDRHCFVYGTIPATSGYEHVPCVGFLAHLDTIPDFPGENVKPRLIENYDGGDIALGSSGRVLSPHEFPHLTALVGRSLIVTDGTTVLGADDKAGVAEIMTMAEELMKGEIPHGKIAIGFCPDEEIGHGADLMDLKRLGAKYAYTADGGAEGGIEYENFNAAAATVTLHGFNVHPGAAKDTMINASLAAIDFNAMLPNCDVPARTEGYEGFYHLIDINGNVERCVINYIIRDHDMGSFKSRKNTMERISHYINQKYGEGTCELEIHDQYYNMCDELRDSFHVVELALEAIRDSGIEPCVEPIRGGTDGAHLTFRGLPCPNLGTGGYAYHGPYEHISVEGMEKATEILLNIVKRYAK